MSSDNIPPRFVRTQQDATQFAAAFNSNLEKLRAEPQEQLFKTVKPPFKCNGCKRKIQLSHGYKVSKEKLCERCAQTALVHGYQLVKRSETLTGRRLISDGARSVCEQLSPKTPTAN